MHDQTLTGLFLPTIQKRKQKSLGTRLDRRLNYILSSIAPAILNDILNLTRTNTVSDEIQFPTIFFWNKIGKIYLERFCK